MQKEARKKQCYITLVPLKVILDTGNIKGEEIPVALVILNANISLSLIINPTLLKAFTKKGLPLKGTSVSFLPLTFRSLNRRHQLVYCIGKYSIVFEILINYSSRCQVDITTVTVYRFSLHFQVKFTMCYRTLYDGRTCSIDVSQIIWINDYCFGGIIISPLIHDIAEHRLVE